jgi:hypothetical protein
MCGFAAGLLLLLGIIIGVARTDETLVSLWQVLPWTVVPVFALGWFFLWVFADELRDRWQVILAVLVGGIAFGASAWVYAYGFGFDPFIHQAAARYLAEHYVIALPSPLYAGYYGLLAASSWISPFSVAQIDRVLVPLCMTIFFGWWVVRGVTIWALPRWAGWGLILLPFGFATFSVPYHLSVVCMLWLIAALPRVRLSPWLIVFLAVLCVIHPLLAFPATVAMLGVVWRPSLASWWKLALLALLTSGGILALFWIYAAQGGGTLILPSWAHVHRALGVVTGFPFSHEPLSVWLVIVWRMQHVWMFLATLIGVVGLVRFAPPTHRVPALTLVSCMFGVAVALVLIAAGASFENILPTEQFEFALRLRNSLPWLVFPGLGYSLVWLVARTSRMIVGGVCAVLIGMVWYTAYPLYAPGGAYAAPGLGRSEVEAFELAEQVSGAEPYAALAPQMVSAAALRSFGFERALATVDGERYPYAIPTGGELYRWYLQLWSERDPAELLRTVCQFAQTPQIVVIMPAAWDPQRWIDVRLAGIAELAVTPDQRHRVYRYSCAE